MELDCVLCGRGVRSYPTLRQSAMGQILHQIIVYYNAHRCMQYADISNGTSVLQCFHHTTAERTWHANSCCEITCIAHGGSNLMLTSRLLSLSFILANGTGSSVVYFYVK
jgi:hypothetical protein